MSRVLPVLLEGHTYHALDRNRFIVRRKGSNVSYVFVKVDSLWEIEKIQGGRVLIHAKLKLPPAYLDQLRSLPSG